MRFESWLTDLRLQLRTVTKPASSVLPSSHWNHALIPTKTIEL